MKKIAERIISVVLVIIMLLSSQSVCFANDITETKETNITAENDTDSSDELQLKNRDSRQYTENSNEIVENANTETESIDPAVVHKKTPEANTVDTENSETDSADTIEEKSERAELSEKEWKLLSDDDLESWLMSGENESYIIELLRQNCIYNPESSSSSDEETDLSMQTENDAESIYARVEAVENQEKRELLKSYLSYLCNKANYPDGIVGMPFGFELSDSENEAKRKMADNFDYSGFCALKEGEDYAEDQIVYSAFSEEYARIIARAYGAELISYEYLIAVAELRGADVSTAMQYSVAPDNNFPVVNPNYITMVNPEITESPMLTLFSMQSAVPVQAGWEMWRGYCNATEGITMDDYLSDPSSASYQYMHDSVNSYAAWGVTMGKGTTVAVVDSGVARNHEDLHVAAEDYLNFSSASSPYGTISHGSHVSGIISASFGNGKGGAGIAPETRIISCRVTDNNNAVYDAPFIRAMNYLSGVSDGSGRKADIINLSLGGANYSAAVENAVENCIDSGITVIAAMGNNYSNKKCYPAALSIPGLISVMATDKTGHRAYFSNYGIWGDVSAPGDNIYSSSLYGYSKMSGTSQAAAVVSGLCALYMSAYGHIDPISMENVLKSSLTNGIVDAVKLFKGDNTAPVISIAETVLKPAETILIPYGSKLLISSQGDGGNTKKIIYTVDGTSPSVYDGKIKNGKIYDGPIELRSADGFEIGKAVTIKALCVSGLGIAGKIATANIKIDYAEPEAVSIIGFENGKILTAGRSLNLSALVSPTEASSAVMWEIVNNEDFPHASINNNGKLTTSAADVGEKTEKVLLIRAASTENADISSELSIRIVGKKAVKKILAYANDTDRSLSLTRGEASKLHAVAYDAEMNDITSDVSFTWKSSNNKIVEVDTNGNITALSKGSARITATCQDGSLTSASIWVSVRQAVEEICISGQESVSPGKTAVYKVSVFPTSANNRRIVWGIADITENCEGYISFDSERGKYTVSPAAPADKDISFTVTATATDGSGVVAQKRIYIKRMVTGLKLSVENNVLFRYDIPDETGKKENVAQINVTASGNPDPILLWRTSNSKIVTVDAAGVVTAVGNGTAVVTCTASDGSNKKASIRITVINPASSISVSGQTEVIKNGDSPCAVIAAGKSAKYTCTIGSAYGKPSITKIKWSVELSRKTSGGEKIVYPSWACSVNLNGRVTVSGRMAKEIELYGNDAWIGSVKAETTDGTGLSESRLFYISRPITKITPYAGNPSLLTVSKGKTIKYWFQVKGNDDVYPEVFSVSSSNPDIVSAGYMVGCYDASKACCYISVTGLSQGIAYLTVKAMDGSGKQMSIKVTVE